MAVSGIFERQRKHTRQSTRLLILFVVGLFLIAGFMHLQAGIISLMLGHGSEDDWLFSDYALSLMAVAYGMILLGATFRYLELREGGLAVARHYGAVQIEPGSTTTKKEKALLSIIDEVSIAAMEKPVPLWLLSAEGGINAFVVGDDNNYALVVTRGALESLNKTQLRAMVAHEFAHISNGDLPHNMRVLVVLSGLLAMQQIAKMAINSAVLPAVIVGYALYFFALPGTFSASIIAMAFTRQREFLADAKAVQFTRNPLAFAETLDFVANCDLPTKLNGICADEIENFCFVPFREKKVPDLLLGQPGVNERIKRIDPYFQVRKSTQERVSLRTKNPQTVADSLGLGVVSETDAGSTGTAGLALEAGDHPLRSVTGGLPDQLVFALQAEHAPEAALFALLLYRFGGSSQLFLKAMQLKGNRAQSVLANRFQTTLADFFDSHDDAIISHVAERLKATHSDDQLQALYSELLQISQLDGSHNLHEYLLLDRIANELGGDTAIGGENVESALSLEQSVGLILALLVGASGQKSKRQQVRYETVMRVYGYTAVNPELMDSKNLVANLRAALAVLLQQMPAVREAFVMHCAEIILEDAHVTRVERSLLSLLSSTLKVDPPNLH